MFHRTSGFLLACALGAVACAPGAPVALPATPQTTPGPADTLEFHRFGKPTTNNVGIVALRADREFDTPAKP